MPNKLLERLRSCLAAPSPSSDRPLKRSLYTTSTPAHRPQTPKAPMEVNVAPSVVSERTTPSEPKVGEISRDPPRPPRSPPPSSVRWASGVPDRPGTPIVPLELDLPPPIDLGFGPITSRTKTESAAPLLCDKPRPTATTEETKDVL